MGRTENPNLKNDYERACGWYGHFNKSEMALSYECTDKYAQKLLDTADIVREAMFANTPEESPAITTNNFGKGRAIYVAVPAQMPILAPLVRSLYADLRIERGPETPSGVYARVVEGKTLYVNTTADEKTITIGGSRRGVISGKSYSGTLRLKPYDAELVE